MFRRITVPVQMLNVSSLLPQSIMGASRVRLVVVGQGVTFNTCVGRWAGRSRWLCNGDMAGLDAVGGCAMLAWLGCCSLCARTNRSYRY